MHKKVKRIEEDEDEEEVEQLEVVLKPNKEAQGEELTEKKLKPRRAESVEVPAEAETKANAQSNEGKPPGRALEAAEAERIQVDADDGRPQRAEVSDEATKARPRRAVEATVADVVTVNGDAHAADEADAGGQGSQGAQRAGKRRPERSAPRSPRHAHRCPANAASRDKPPTTRFLASFSLVFFFSAETRPSAPPGLIEVAKSVDLSPASRKIQRESPSPTGACRDNLDVVDVVCPCT